MRWRTSPLGLDVGSTRVRLACVERNASGAVRLCAAATQTIAIESEPVIAAADAVRQAARTLGRSERRCVVAVREPDARVTLRRFPKMTASERKRAARFEADATLLRDKGDRAVVTLHGLDVRIGLYAVGIARLAVIERARRIVASAGLDLLGVDLDALALRRAIPATQLVIDIGLHRSSVHFMAPSETRSAMLSLGGSSITRAIAAELLLDETAAEERKVRLGAAGTADAARRELVAAVGASVVRLRRDTPVAEVAIVGNGSRLAGLRREIERETGARAAVQLPPPLRSDAYPDDVAASAVPDWALAVGLARWEVPG